MVEKMNRSNLEKKLRSNLIKQRLVLFGAGILISGAAVILTSIILSVIATVVILPVSVKITLLILSGLIALLVFGKFALSKFFSGSIDSAAVTLEKKFPELKGRLIAAVQFARMKKTPGFSSALIDQTEKQAIEKAGLINFNETLSFYPVLKSGRLLIISAVFALLLLCIFP